MKGNVLRVLKSAPLTGTVERQRQSCPTVLIATACVEMRATIGRGLPASRYLILEADTLDLLLNFVRTHSRAIHVLLLDAKMAHLSAIAQIVQLRPKMKVLVITPDSEGMLPGATPVTSATLNARRLLELAG